VSGLLARPVPAAAGSGSASAARSAERATWDPQVIRIVTFGALAAFGAAHWAMLVADARGGRTLLVVLVAVAGAGGLTLLGRSPLPRPAVHALAAVVAVATIALGLMAAGMPARLLAPNGWTELFDGLDRGLAGVENVEWPYEGPDHWIRLTILLGAPFLLGIAAAVAFWPASRSAPLLRLAGLAVLLLLYGAAVTEHDPGRPLLRGFGLLLLVAAWLWLPRMPRHEAALGAAVVAGVGVLSMPLAAALDGDRPWWDYRAWSWFADGRSITFDWTHRYGPLDWPREGTTLLNVKSDRPHYWKAQVLDGFDGFRWVATDINKQDVVSAEVPNRSVRRAGPVWNNFEWNPRWAETIRFTVRSLTSTLVVTAGNAQDVDGIDATLFANGTGLLLGDPLERGDSYVVETYAPAPTRAQMRAAFPGYPEGLVSYTAIELPPPGASALDAVGRRRGDTLRLRPESEGTPVFVGLRDDPDTGSPNAQALLRESVYARTYDLARRLTDGVPNGYDAVKAVERHLQENYVYSEHVPSADVPLEDFLFRQEAGYCQQFSGAMALMLRLIGIPARVVAGFSPGSFNRDTGEYRVRDLDAHSWVEVYFTGIGWVPFDPTPTIAPADSQSGGATATSAAPSAGDVRRAGRISGGASERSGDPGGQFSDEGGGAGWVLPALAAVVLVLVGSIALLLALRMRRVHRLTPGELVEAQLAELRRALVRLGWDVPAATTLLALERRLGTVAGPASAAYAGGLRAHRYDPRAPAAPNADERRALRRELSARDGLRGRLRGLLAFPPGGPRPSAPGGPRS
jgi:protein-glutamine gamma-glutamyltransferase